MRRLAATFLLLCGIVCFWVFAGGASGSSGTKYWVELDNGFGLVKGGDVKIAGVRAGTVSALELDRATNRALIQIEITKGGFGSLRTDVVCQSRPQSLIGEYFVDCLPGTDRQELKPGSTIGVAHTESTVPPDLVNDVLRKPYRERLSVILSELGAGVAGNEQNLNDAIRRASPALRETDKVLATLAQQNKVLRDLAVNADTVVGDLAANKQDVGRFVDEASNTAVASAERRDAIAAGFHKLPGFLKQLTPTMAALGRTADAQTPALRNLRASAAQLERFFGQLGPFADASRPAFKALGSAAVTGRKAVRVAKPAVTQLRRFARGTPELGKNLAIVLQHLDDPKYAVEDDPRAAKSTGRAMPTGYTGLEALLMYLYDQTMATNIYDQNSHILKIGLIPLLVNDCADYADVARAKAVGNHCAATLGPNQPGINFTDPTPKYTQARSVSHDSGPKNNVDLPTALKKITTPAAPGASGPATSSPQAPAQKPLTIDIPEILPGIDPPPIKLPGVLGDLLNPNKGKASSDKAGAGLLDYLLGGNR
jgi:virulence factor Mce-like protein